MLPEICFHFAIFVSTVAGYQWSDIEVCIEWMAAFARILRESGPAEFKFFDRIPSSEVHNIQTHTTNMKLLVRMFICNRAFNAVLRLEHCLRWSQ